MEMTTMYKKSESVRGHAAALLTILIWGVTFISTKILLTAFTPIEILFIRFLIGYLALWLVCPRRLVLKGFRQEGWFAAAGLCGIALYYLLENVALTMTRASNVGVIISVAPLFTALFSWLFLHGPRPGLPFLTGFVIAITGVCLLGLGESTMSVHPMGDLLAVAAAAVWAVYSMLTKVIGGFGYPVVQATRRTFFYGLCFMLPALFMMDTYPELSRFSEPRYIVNLLFLGAGASALCFVTWNAAVRRLGPIQTSVYIYIVPVITATASALILKEPVTAASAGGIALTLTGLFLSGRGGAENGK